MSTETDIIDHLAGESDVTDIVGSKLYLSGSVPQNTAAPYLTVQRISTNHHDASGGSTGLTNGRLQIDCYQLNPELAKTLKDAVKLRLKNVRRPTGIAGSAVKTIIPLDERDIFDVDESGNYIGQPGVSLDFSVWFEEATS